MKKVFKFAGYLGAAVVLFFLVAGVAFYHLTRTGDFRRYLISAIEQQTDLKVQLGEAHLDVGRILGISFRDVALAESDLAAPALSAERVTARVALWPLLNRQLVFYEVRLQKPDARLTRDRQGKIPFLERLLNVPFLKQNHAQFAVDLRTVKIADGGFEFIDEFPEAAPVITRFHDVALVLERARAAALREILRQWVESETAQPQGAALTFELDAGVEREGQRVEWRAQGKLVFPESKLDIAQAWCDVETRISGTPAALARIYGDKSLTATNLGGLLNARLKMQGSVQQRLHVTGMVDFDRLSINAPELFDRPLDAGDGRFHIDIQYQPEHWTLSRMDFRSKELTFGVTGQLKPLANAGMQLRLDLTAKPLPIKVVKKYLPAQWLASTPLDRFFGAVTEGELILHKAGVNARSGEIRAMLNTGLDDRLWFDAEIRKGAANFSGDYPPVRDLNGRIVLEKGRLGFHNVSATSGQNRLANVEGSYDLQGDSGVLQLRARGETELGDLRTQAQRGLLPAEVTNALLSVQSLGGRSTFDVALTWLDGGAARAEGQLTLENARLQWDTHALTGIDGNLMFTPTEIKTETLRGLIHGSPVELRLALRNYAAADGMFDLTVESAGVKAGIVSSLFLDKGSMQDAGTVRGSVRYRGLLNDKQRRKFTGSLELVNVQMPVYPLLQPLRQLNGKISIDENGIDFQNLNGLLVGVPASASARWRYAQKPQLIFDFAAPGLDVSYLISQIDPEPTDFYDTLQAEGRIALAKGRLKNFDFADLKTNIILDRRTWRFPNLTIRGGGGAVSGPLTVAHRPDTLGIVTEPKIHNVPMAAFLRWLEITHSDVTGTLDIAGKFTTSGSNEAERKRNLNGAFSLKISEGTIHRMRMLVQLLNVLDLSRWFTFQMPDLSKQGIRFRAITGDFKVNQGVYYTENLVVDSDDLRMTGAGKIDVPKDEIDLVVAVRPFSGVDTAINYIPLLGRGIAAVKNSFLVASFNIKGRIDDPTITPAPLGTLSEWVLGVLRIPRSLIPFGAAEKDAPKEPAQETPAAPNR